VRLCGLVVIAWLCAGCAVRPASAWQPDQAEATAWWIEDLVHGTPRDIAELDAIPGNERTRAILLWMRGGAEGLAWQPPQLLHERSERWPEVRQAIAAGDAVPVPDSGLLAPFAGLSPLRRAAVESLIDAENNARRLIDHMVLELGRPDSGVEAAYRAAIRCARRTYEAASSAPDVPGSTPAH
jgi:hypothetical protein